MNRNEVIIFLIVLLSFTGCSRKFETRYDNGQKLSEGEFKNGRKIGKWMYWDESGKVRSES